MFEKFGEMDSFLEINELADNLMNEGDEKSVMALAEENGIEKEAAKAYINAYQAGEMMDLCDAADAAAGKIDMECRELKPKEIMQDWVDYISVQCQENEEVALGVRKKGKTLKGCIAALLMWSFRNQQQIDKEITKAAGINARVTLGIPGMGRAKKIIREYYLS